MASSPSQQPHHRRHHHHHHPTKFLSNFIQSTTSNFSSLLSSAAAHRRFPSPKPKPPNPPFRICFPVLSADSPSPLSAPTDSISDSPPVVDGSLPRGSGVGVSQAVTIAGVNSGGKDGGPAFIGQVFSMCDLSGTGLMAVSTHFNIPFLSKRTPGWLKKMFASITKSERNGPVFHFFMDLGDAVEYVKRLNIPSGVVGACRLDLAYEHFKEKPHLFQFVPNEKQVKAANKLLKTNPQYGGRRRIDGVPVFSAQNLDIAIATTNGIKWYTPYFFDKGMLDNILEDSVDQHFQSLIQSRRTQHWKDAIDDNLTTEVMEENSESIWEPPEVQDAMDELGHPGIPLSVISKAAKIQLLHAVDRALLGNKWLRKATGIQPEFPYMVDSFERRSTASLRASECSSYCMKSHQNEDLQCLELGSERDTPDGKSQLDIWFPFRGWFSSSQLKQRKLQNVSDTRVEGLQEDCLHQELQPNPFLPKITMVGMATGEAGQMNKAAFKKAVEDLTKQLEQADLGTDASSSSDELKSKFRDPLFVADVGNYFSGLGKTGSARMVRPRNV